MPLFPTYRYKCTLYPEIKFNTSQIKMFCALVYTHVLNKCIWIWKHFHIQIQTEYWKCDVGWSVSDAQQLLYTTSMPIKVTDIPFQNLRSPVHRLLNSCTGLLQRDMCTTLYNKYYCLCTSNAHCTCFSHNHTWSSPERIRERVVPTLVLVVVHRVHFFATSQVLLGREIRNRKLTIAAKHCTVDVHVWYVHAWHLV